MQSEPETKEEVIGWLLNMPNREIRRKYFKIWHKKFGIIWEEISMRTRKKTT